MKNPRTPFSTHLSGLVKETELRLRNIFQWKKKRPPIPLFILTVVVLMSCFGLVSCRVEEPALPAADSAAEPSAVTPFEDPVPADTPEPETTPAPTTDPLSFTDLRNCDFCFSSGAGAWATALNIRDDGSFFGEYHDSDMSAYYDAMQYYCAFSGQFTPLIRINEYTYATQISSMQYENEVGTEEVKDNILYIYSEAYGLENAETILIYLPGASLAELPQEFLSWVGYPDLSYTEDTELPFYGLYNQADQCGFSGYDIVKALKSSLSDVEQYAAELERSLENDALTQAQLNDKSKGLYELWDSFLNRQWTVLKRVLDPETMDVLLAEQREWIQQKEAAVAQAGAEVEGGSIFPTVTNSKAAELTKARVYELMEFLPCPPAERSSP